MPSRPLSASTIGTGASSSTQSSSTQSSTELLHRAAKPGLAARHAAESQIGVGLQFSGLSVQLLTA